MSSLDPAPSTTGGRVPGAAGHDDGDQPGAVAGVLHTRRFLALWLAQVASQIGGNMVLFGLTVLVSARTNSYEAVSLLIFSFLAPAVVFSAIAGVYVDRLDRRLVLVDTNVLRGLAVVAIVIVQEQITLVYSRGWMLSFYGLTICALLALRYAYVQVTVLGSRTGLISAQRVFLVGAGRNIEDFVTRYHPRRFGINIVGCHFLTPVEAQAPAAAREQALARDLEQVIVGARSLQPEAIVLVMPWHDTDTIDRCAETLRKLPTEVHLGPEHILDRFEQVELVKIGSISSLQLRRTPLSRLELLEKRAFDLLLRGSTCHDVFELLLLLLLLHVSLCLGLDDR
jgi:FlaA1/EpsC-like NDP-sugar epimerase